MRTLTGTSIGRYKILEQLGEGGMATVYKAYDIQLEREVAIKVVHQSAISEESSEVLLKRCKQEARLLAGLNHPHIVTLLDYGEHEGLLYLVTTYISGGNLKGMLGRPIPWEAATALLVPVARALEYAHTQGILHRDIKPANILLSQGGLPVLADFGIAKVLESITKPGSNPRTRTDLGSLSHGSPDQLTRTDMGIGTPDYMAPEQVRGKVTVQSDIYSLGVVFYEMVTGRRPFIADTPLTVLLMHVSDPLPPPRQIQPGLPVEVEKVLFKALAKKPEERYQSMSEFADILESLTGGRFHAHSQQAAPHLPVAFPPEKSLPDSAITDLSARPARRGFKKPRYGFPGKPLLAVRLTAGLLILLAAAGLVLLGMKLLDTEWLAAKTLAPTPTTILTLTMTPSQTTIPTSTFTPRPTATVSAETLTGSSSALCDQAFQLTLTSGAAAEPMLFLRYQNYENGIWQYEDSVPHLWAVSAEEVRSLVCIRETRQQYNTYTDGEPAYHLVWEVRLTSWPEGRPFATSTFVGDNAPFVKFSPGPGYGSTPSKKLLDWLLSLLQERTIISIGKGIPNLAFSPDGKYLAIGITTPITVHWSGTYQGSPWLWNLSTWSLALTFSGHSAVDNAVLVPAVAFSPDGTMLATGGNDSDTLLWNPVTGTLLRKLIGRDQPILYIAFSPLGGALAVLDKGGKVVLWDLETGDEKWEAFVTLTVDLTGPEKPLGTRLAFLPDGSQLAVTAGNGIIFFDTATGEQARTLPVTGISLAISPDGKYLATGGTSGTITLLELHSQEQRILSGHSETITALAFSPDGSLLASASKDETIILWEVGTASLVRTLFGHRSEVWSLAYSPDGLQLASGSEDGTVRLWEGK